jgi:hypothetical protein
MNPQSMKISFTTDDGELLVQTAVDVRIDGAFSQVDVIASAIEAAGIISARLRATPGCASEAAVDVVEPTSDRITYTPREKAPQGSRVTSWWVDGSRDRFGEALFISEKTIIRTGSEQTKTIVWLNRRPHAVNEVLCELDRRPYTYDELERELTLARAGRR